MILDSSGKLQIILGEAATTQLPVSVGSMDRTAAAGVIDDTMTLNVTNSTTAVDILAAPAASTFRKVKSVCVQNADNIPHIVTIRINVSATLYTQVKLTLAVNYTLLYSDAGWQVTDNSGGLITTPSTLTMGIYLMNAAFAI